MRSPLLLLPLIALLTSACATSAPRPIVGYPLPRNYGAPDRILLEEKSSVGLALKDALTENQIWGGVFSKYFDLSKGEYDTIRDINGNTYQRDGRLWHRVTTKN